MITILEDQCDVDTYLSLREQVGWVELERSQAEAALHNSLKVFTAYDECNRPIGMGRIVGDGAVICYIQDLIIIPDYQGKHIGSMLLDRLISYVRSLTAPNTRMMLCLMCAKGREIFYEKHGFTARPNTLLGPGMIQYLEERRKK